MAMRRSVSSSSAGTPEASSDFGFDAAMCMAKSLPNWSSPPLTSISTPIFAPPWT